MNDQKAHIEEVIEAAILWNSDDGDKPDPAPPEWEAVFPMIRTAPHMVRALRECLGAMQAMRDQIEQMRGMFDDADETIEGACQSHDETDAVVHALLHRTRPPEDVRTEHFRRLNDYQGTVEYAEFRRSIGEPAAPATRRLVGQRWEINVAIYDEFLNMMPPLLWRGGTFYTPEALLEGIHAKFSREADRYFCEYARLPSRDNRTVPKIGCP